VFVAILAYVYAWLIPLNRTFGVGAGPVHVVDDEEKHT
jgi:hypothetical protein